MKGPGWGGRAAYKDVLWCARSNACLLLARRRCDRSDWLSEPRYSKSGGWRTGLPAFRITTSSALPIRGASPPADDPSLPISATHRPHTSTPAASPPQPRIQPTQPFHLIPISNPLEMPPKAQKTPTTGGKAPAGKAPAEKKEAGKKTAAPSGEKKKRTKTRKETYSSYIYKGEIPDAPCALRSVLTSFQSSSRFIPIPVLATGP